ADPEHRLEAGIRQLDQDGRQVGRHECDDAKAKHHADGDRKTKAAREPKGCQGEKGACNLADRPEEFGVEHWCAPKFALTRERRGPLCPPEKGREAEASLSFLHREETPR